MIPHIHTLYEFISIQYENQHQTLNIKKIDRAKLGFEIIESRYYNLKRKYLLPITFFLFAYWFLKIFLMRRYMTQCTFIDNSRFMTFQKSLHVLKFWHKRAYFDQIMLCAKIYITIKFFLFVNIQQSYFKLTNCVPIFKKYMVSKVFRHFWFHQFSRNSILNVIVAWFFCVQKLEWNPQNMTSLACQHSNIPIQITYH